MTISNKEIINSLIQRLDMPEEDRNEISDGYHTFKELYDHRVKLFIALCNTISKIRDEFGEEHKRPWKSKFHFDSSMWDGWFIAGIGMGKGETLTYHLPISEWDNLDAEDIDFAPEWDGHTSDDVLILLTKL